MSLMGSLFVGVSGLRVNQNGLNVTAHNLANVDTNGYVRQQQLSSDFRYQKYGMAAISSMQIGLGTDIVAIRQVRCQFLDRSYRNEVGRLGFYESQSNAISEIEDLFQEVDGIPQYGVQLQELWNTLQELAKTPNEIDVRENLINKANNFIQKTDKIWGQIEEYQRGINQQITDQVNMINNYADQIKELNDKISSIEGGGLEAANDYRDARNVLLDELSKIADISVSEDQNGCVRVNLEGQALVTENNAYHLTTKELNDSSTFLKPVWERTGADVYDLTIPCDLAKGNDKGSLKGLLIARGDDVGRYTDIPKRENYANDADYEKASAEYFATTDVSAVPRTQAQFDQLLHAFVTTINDIMSPNKEIQIQDPTNPGATITITVLDEDNAPVGMDGKHSPGEPLFERKNMPRYTERTVVIMPGGQTATVREYNKEDPDDIYSLYTIGQIEVNPDVLKDRSVLSISDKNSPKEENRDVINKLTEAWDKKCLTLDPNSTKADTFMDYYNNAFMGRIASEGYILGSMTDNQSAAVHEEQNKRLSDHGVSADEELTNMIKYQHAYNASSRYITVVNEMLEHLVTRL